MDKGKSLIVVLIVLFVLLACFVIVRSIIRKNLQKPVFTEDVSNKTESSKDSGSSLFGESSENNASSESGELSAESDPKRDVFNGKIISCSYSAGGSSLGDWYYLALEQDEEGQFFLTVSKREMNGEPTSVNVYSVDASTVETVKVFLGQYDPSLWEAFPESELEVLDAGSESILLIIDESSTGGESTVFYSLSDTQELPEDWQGIFSSFRDLLEGFAVEENLVDAYFYEE